MAKASNKTVRIEGVTVITEASKLGTAITSIANRGKRLDDDVHKAGVSCLYHAREHGDITLFARLVEALPRGTRRLAFIQWAQDHAPVEHDDGAFTLTKGRKADDFDLVGAAVTPFWDHTKEVAPKTVGREQLIRTLQQYAAGGSGKRKVDDAGVAAALQALKALGVQPKAVAAKAAA